MNKTTLVVAVFVAVLVLCLVKFNFSFSAPQNRETFAQKEVGMPVEGVGMGPYDNVSIPGASGWLMTESAPKGASPIGAQKNLDFLLHPRTSPSCCPSAFTTDTGCVCVSEQDRGTMASRGGNKV